MRYPPSAFLAIAALLHPATASAHSWSANRLATERPTLMVLAATNADAITNIAAGLLESGRYDALEYSYTLLRDGHAFLPGNVPRLGAFYSGLVPTRAGYQFASAEQVQAAQRKREAAITAWLAAKPDSTPARIALSMMHQDRAWQERGHGYAPDVTASQWQAFASELQSAADVLTEGIQPDPEAFSSIISLGMAAGWPEDVQTRVYDAAIAEFSTYPNIHYARAIALLPRWGGSPAALCDLSQSLATLPGEAGVIAYSAVADAMAIDGATLETVAAAHCLEWDRLKESYDLRARLDRLGNDAANVYLAMAVRARDHAAAAEAAKFITASFSTCWSSETMFNSAMRWAQGE